MVSNTLIKNSRLPEVFFNKLDNGLQHVHIQTPNTATFSLRLGLRAGQVYGSIAESGMAHFLEHLVFSGTKKYPKRKDLYDLIDFVGGSHNASTGWHTVQYYANTLAKDAENAFDFISQIMIYPLLQESDFDREKNIILDEARGKLSSIHYLSWQKLQQMYFNDTRWQTSAVGTVADVEAITLSGIKSFYDRFYTPSNAVLVSAGPQSNIDMLNVAKQYFSDWQDSAESTLPFPKPDLNETGLDYENYITDLAEQTMVNIVKPGPTESEVLDFSQSIANCLLGGQSYSRLFEYLREDKGLSYSLGTNFSRHHNYGVWQFSAGLNYDNLETFASAYQETLGSFADKPITGREVERAKNDFLASLLFSAEQTSSLTGMWLSDMLDNTQSESMAALVSLVELSDTESIQHWINDYIERPSKVLVTSQRPVEKSLVKSFYESNL